MTLSDPDRAGVHLDRIPTTIANLAAQRAPRTIGKRRTTGFQLVSWRMQAVVDRYRIASNGEIVLVLYDIPSNTYMDAYLPNPHCLGSRARDRLGLYISREIVEQMGGVLSVRSRRGVGSTFTVTLPRVQTPALQPA